MRRRDFIRLVGAAAAWSHRAIAESTAPLRRIGVLMTVSETDADARLNLAAFRESLTELGVTGQSTL
jgi:hypothetical protein